MKDQIRIETEVCASLNKNMKNLRTKLQGYANELERIRMTRSSGASLRVALSVRLKTTGGRASSGDADDCVTRLANLTDGLGDYANRLAKAMREIEEIFEDGERELESAATLAALEAAPYMQGTSSAALSSADLSAMEAGGATDEDIGAVTESPLNGGTAYLVGDTVIGWLTQDGNTQLVGPEIELFSSKLEGGEDEVSKQWNLGDEDSEYAKSDDVNMFEDRVSVLEIKAETGVSESVWDGEARATGENGTAGIGMGVLNGEAEASASGGFWSVTTDENGNEVRHFTPGVAAEAGVSGSVLDIAGDASYEIVDGLEVSANGNVEVLSAEAKGEAALGIVDGELNAYVGVSAEVNLAEAEGDVGVDDGGVKGTIGGSVTVGAGAHADIGYKDGVLKIDVGAAIGVGGSVKCELDLSGLWQNIGNGLESVRDSLYNM